MAGDSAQSRGILHTMIQHRYNTLFYVWNSDIERYSTISTNGTPLQYIIGDMLTDLFTKGGFLCNGVQNIRLRIGNSNITCIKRLSDIKVQIDTIYEIR